MQVFFLKEVRSGLGLALHHGWAKLMPAPCRDPLRQLNQPRSMAVEATDEDGEEACAFYHHTHPPDCGAVGP